MPCPECGASDDQITKSGFAYRKRTVGPGNIQGARIRKYQCHKCGLCTRGSRFGLPEFEDGDEKEGDMTGDEFNE